MPESAFHSNIPKDNSAFTGYREKFRAALIAAAVWHKSEMAPASRLSRAGLVEAYHHVRGTPTQGQLNDEKFIIQITNATSLNEMLTTCLELALNSESSVRFAPMIAHVIATHFNITARTISDYFNDKKQFPVAIALYSKPLSRYCIFATDTEHRPAFDIALKKAVADFTFNTLLELARKSDDRIGAKTEAAAEAKSDVRAEAAEAASTAAAAAAKLSAEEISAAAAAAAAEAEAMIQRNNLFKDALSAAATHYVEHPPSDLWRTLERLACRLTGNQAAGMQRAASLRESLYAEHGIEFKSLLQLCSNVLTEKSSIYGASLIARVVEVILAIPTQYIIDRFEHNNPYPPGFLEKSNAIVRYWAFATQESTYEQYVLALKAVMSHEINQAVSTPSAGAAAAAPDRRAAFS